MEIWIRRSYEFDCPRTKLNFSRSIAQFAQVDKDVKLLRLYLWLTDRLTDEVIAMMKSCYTSASLGALFVIDEWKKCYESVKGLI